MLTCVLTLNVTVTLTDAEVLIPLNLRIPQRILQPNNQQKSALLIAEHQVKRAKIENPAAVTDDQVVTAATRALEATITGVIDRAVKRAVTREMNFYHNNLHPRGINEAAVDREQPIISFVTENGRPPNFPATRGALEDLTIAQLRVFCQFYDIDEWGNQNPLKVAVVAKLKTHLAIPLWEPQ